MYNWRKMTDEQRMEALEIRKRFGQPWHSPPHGFEKNWYHISAACYEHKGIIGFSPKRMALFEKGLLHCLALNTERVTAWCVLPNHYHVLIQTRSLPQIRRDLGKLHGSLSREWNQEERQIRRKCWHRVLPKPVKNEAHKLAVINYIHHNPVHHRYVRKWQEWLYSSVENHLRELGKARVLEQWENYPLYNMGEGWDEPEM